MKLPNQSENKLVKNKAEAQKRKETKQKETTTTKLSRTDTLTMKKTAKCFMKINIFFSSCRFVVVVVVMVIVMVVARSPDISFVHSWVFVCSFYSRSIICIECRAQTSRKTDNLSACFENTTIFFSS